MAKTPEESGEEIAMLESKEVTTKPKPKDVQIEIGADDEARSGGCCETLLLMFSFLFLLITFPLSIWSCVYILKEYERAVIFRFGKARSKKPVGPGLYFVLPCVDSTRVVDLRTVTFDIDPQEILTKDSVTVNVDAVVYFKVTDPWTSVCSVEDSHKSTKLLASTNLRNIFGTRTLQEILSDRESIGKEILQHLDEATDPWGICVERVEVKDVRLPAQMQRSMAAEAEATREARAKVIAAEGEQKASRALKEASDIISQSQSALQLRYLQTLNNIAAEKNSTIVFPLPIEMLQKFIQPSA